MEITAKGASSHMTAAGGGSEMTLYEDGALVAQAKEKREAFDALYLKYLKKVYTYIYYRVGNIEDAEDITESVFLHALIHLDRYQDRGIPFSAWLLRIAHNLVANWHRNAGRRRGVVLDAADSIQDSSPTPEEAAESRDDIRELREAMRGLSAERQQALILRFAEGMKHREIGEVRGKSAGAVKGLVHRSLAGLRGSV